MTSDAISGHQLNTMLKNKFITTNQRNGIYTAMRYQVFTNHPDAPDAISHGGLTITCSQLKSLYKKGVLEKQTYNYAFQVFKIYSKLME